MMGTWLQPSVLTGVLTCKIVEWVVGVSLNLLVLWILLNEQARRHRSGAWSSLAVFLSFMGIYALSSVTIHAGPLAQSWPSHYVRLADALAHGRLYLQESFFEVTTYHGHIYVMEPIFPALLMLPFVAMVGKGFYDVCFLIIVGAMNVAMVFALWPKIAAAIPRVSNSLASRYWLTLLFGLGTPHWYLAIGGRVWHAEGVVALWCLLLAMHEALGKGRFPLVCLYLGWAFLSHPPTIFSFPFFALCFLSSSRGTTSRPSARIIRDGLIGLLLLFTEIALGWGWYNYARFGNVFEAGVTPAYLDDVAHGVAPPYGLFDLRYLPRNLWIALIRFPGLRWEVPYAKMDPLGVGMASGFGIFWATPAFVYLFGSLRFLRRSMIVLGSWLALTMILACLMMFDNAGATQLGYRRILDAMPFILLLTAVGIRDVRRNVALGLIGGSILINAIGTLWFYRFH